MFSLYDHNLPLLCAINIRSMSTNKQFATSEVNCKEKAQQSCNNFSLWNYMKGVRSAFSHVFCVSLPEVLRKRGAAPAAE